MGGTLISQTCPTENTHASLRMKEKQLGWWSAEALPARYAAAGVGCVLGTITCSARGVNVPVWGHTSGCNTRQNVGLLCGPSPGNEVRNLLKLH